MYDVRGCPFEVVHRDVPRSVAFSYFVETPKKRMGYKNLPVVLVRNLGKLGFSKALSEQKLARQSILNKIASNDFESIENYLFLVEHDPVFTVGLRHKEYVKDKDKLKKLGADFTVTDRGGLITFHGPGQLVSYPIIYLGSFSSKKSIRWYVRQLENTLIDVCLQFGLKANTTSDVGVWINDRKVAAIGIHGSRYVTTHGIALNCDVNLDWFSHIVPCGIEGKEVTSLSKELRRQVTVQEALPQYLNSFQNYFPCEYKYDGF